MTLLASETPDTLGPNSRQSDESLTYWGPYIELEIVTATVLDISSRLIRLENPKHILIHTITYTSVDQTTDRVSVQNDLRTKIYTNFLCSTKRTFCGVTLDFRWVSSQVFTRLNVVN